MTDEPKRIWLIDDPHALNPWASTRGEIWAGDKLCLGEYHLARPGQPCSTDDFFRNVMEWWAKHPSDPSDGDLIVKLWNWHDGDFTKAMEGLK